MKKVIVIVAIILGITMPMFSQAENLNEDSCIFNKTGQMWVHEYVDNTYDILFTFEYSNMVPCADGQYKFIIRKDFRSVARKYNRLVGMPIRLDYACEENSKKSFSLVKGEILVYLYNPELGSIKLIEAHSLVKKGLYVYASLLKAETEWFKPGLAITDVKEKNPKYGFNDLMFYYAEKAFKEMPYNY